MVAVYTEEQHGMQLVATMHIDCVPNYDNIWRSLRDGNRVRVSVNMKREDE